MTSSRAVAPIDRPPHQHYLRAPKPRRPYSPPSNWSALPPPNVLPLQHPPLHFPLCSAPRFPSHARSLFQRHRPSPLSLRSISPPSYRFLRAPHSALPFLRTRAPPRIVFFQLTCLVRPSATYPPIPRNCLILILKTFHCHVPRLKHKPNLFCYRQPSYTHTSHQQLTSLSHSHMLLSSSPHPSPPHLFIRACSTPIARDSRTSRLPPVCPLQCHASCHSLRPPHSHSLSPSPLPFIASYFSSGASPGLVAFGDPPTADRAGPFIGCQSHHPTLLPPSSHPPPSSHVV